MYLNKKIAIILFAYNRPSHLRRVLIALEDYKIKNPIYLFLDGPKNKKDKIIQKEITFMVKTNKNLNIKFFYYKKNIGIAKSVFRGIDKISSRFKHIIILEDDTIPRKEFFNYTFSIIKKNYSNEIAAICGYQLPEIHSKYRKVINVLVFDNFIPWGWSIKSRDWKDFRKNYKKERKKKNNIKLSKLLNLLINKVSNKKNIWSLDFMIYNFLNKKKYIFPTKSLIKNIGFDGSGINSKITDRFNTYYTKSTNINVGSYKKYNNLINKQNNILEKVFSFFY